MSVSVNDAYLPVIGKIKYNKRDEPYGAGRLVKTAKYREFESRCVRWELGHKSGVDKLKAEILQRKRELAKQGIQLTFRVQFFAVFPYEKIFTPNGLIEGIDSDNRVKSAKDVLFRILNTNDKFVFIDEIEKIHGSSEYMIIRISEYQPRSEKDLKLSLGLK